MGEKCSILITFLFRFSVKVWIVKPKFTILDPNGETISNVLFYGSEVNLFVFELLSFTIFDVAFKSYVVAATITYLLSTIVWISRQSLARRNMSEKTLIDKRFLI